MASTNPVANDTTDVIQLYRDDTGGLYMDIQVTVGAGTGDNPETAGTHVYRVPVQSRLS